MTTTYFTFMSTFPLPDCRIYISTGRPEQKMRSLHKLQEQVAVSASTYIHNKWTDSDEIHIGTVHYKLGTETDQSV